MSAMPHRCPARRSLQARAGPRIGVERWPGLVWLLWFLLAGWTLDGAYALAQPRAKMAAGQDTLGAVEDAESSAEDVVTWLAKLRQVTIAGAPYGVTGLPIVYYSRHAGWNYGAHLQLADYRRRPYRYKFILHAVRSTEGKVDYFFRLKVPRISGTHFGMLLEGSMEHNLRAHYYGRGNNTANKFIDPSGKKVEDEEYYAYNLDEPRFIFSLLRQLYGPLSMSMGLGMERTDIKPRGQRSFYRDAGTPDGVVGGSTGYISATIEWDTRDDEVMPLLGTYHEWSYESSRNSLLGFFLEQIDFQRYTFTDARHWLFSERFTMGHRTVFEVLTGSIPLYAYGEIGGSRRLKGLGGGDVLRGFDSQRFTDNVRFFTNTEARYLLCTTHWFRQHLEWKGILFMDTGRVWRRLQEVGPDGLHMTAGVGGRVYWNADFVIRVDLGFSAEQAYLGVKYRNLF